DRGSHSPVADRVDMYAEAREMEALDELHDDGALVLQLAARDEALIRVIAVGLREARDTLCRVVPGRILPHVLAQARCRIHVARHRQMTVRILAEDRLQIGREL